MSDARALWVAFCLAPAPACIPLFAAQQVDQGDTEVELTDTTRAAVPHCGDGAVNTDDEECDDGPTNSDTGPCTANCKAARCGDGLIWKGVEGCEDGNGNGGDGCTPTCETPRRVLLITQPVVLEGMQTTPGALGDFDADGIDDLVLPTTGSPTGASFVFGPLLEPTSVGHVGVPILWDRGYFDGHTPVATGDISGDGVPDAALTSSSGVYFVFGGSRPTDTVDLVSTPPHLTALSGVVPRLASVGDADGDDAADLLFQYLDDTSLAPGDTAYLIHGAAAELPSEASAIASAAVVMPGSRVTFPGVPAGDLDGDGTSDVVIADLDSGLRVYGFPGDVTGVVGPDAAAWSAPSASPSRARGGGDLNGDGHADLVLGQFAPLVTHVVYGPLTGEIDPIEAGGAQIGGQYGSPGYVVAGPGDVNNDGADDLLVAAPFTDNNGEVYLIHGVVAGALDVANADWTFVGSIGAEAGYYMGGVGDMDDDGLADFSINGPQGIYVILGADL